MIPVYLKWAGGKFKLLDYIDYVFDAPCDGTWIEPFVGSAVVFFARREAGLIDKALLCDINSALITTHRAIQVDPERVIGHLEGMVTGPEYIDHYEDVRDRFNEWKSELVGTEVLPEFAALFLWLNRACFNGLYRENKAGRFNVPSGRYDRLALPEPDTIRSASKLLRTAELVVCDFTEAFDRAGPLDQVYCDPPYVPRTATSSFTTYSADGFPWEAQQRLAELGSTMAEAGATVVLSNHDLPMVTDLYREKGYSVIPISVQRSISSGPRGSVGEVLARNPGLQVG